MLEKHPLLVQVMAINLLAFTGVHHVFAELKVNVIFCSGLWLLMKVYECVLWSGSVSTLGGHFTAN